jgi:hypothetical protein
MIEETSTPTAATLSTRMNSEQLTAHLARNTGTEYWYEHSVNKSLTYTDGVKAFAEEQGSYWFIDLIALKYHSLLKKNKFLLIKLIVGNDNKAFLSVEDGNENILAQARINFTDVQEGEWKFYLTDNVLLLPSEY